MLELANPLSAALLINQHLPAPAHSALTPKALHALRRRSEPPTSGSGKGSTRSRTTASSGTCGAVGGKSRALSSLPLLRFSFAVSPTSAHLPSLAIVDSTLSSQPTASAPSSSSASTPFRSDCSSPDALAVVAFRPPPEQHHERERKEQQTPVPIAGQAVPAAAFAPPFPRLHTLAKQPSYPGATAPSPDPTSVTLQHQHRLPQPPSQLPPQQQQQRRPFGNDYFLQSPFRSRAPTSPRRLGRLSAARLWNPTNSTPRFVSTNPSTITTPTAAATTRKRRPSTPPPPSVPLQHPALNQSTHAADPVSTGAGDYPLLSLPEQRQTRHSISTRASLQVERSASSDNRVSLPRSVRHSYDGDKDKQQRPANPSPPSTETTEAGPSVPPQFRPGEGIGEFDFGFGRRSLSTNPSPAQDESSGSSPLPATRPRDKGKGKAIMMTPENDDPARSFSKDLERGPDVLVDPRPSNVSAGDLGSPMSSTNSSIMGEEVQPDVGEEWGPQHPCYPHLNPHVPTDSTEYNTTRIIRVRRDWLLEGDLAPTFSNLYPEILDPAGLSEQEFRRVIEKLNTELVPIFSPYSWRNVLDGALGLVTGWLWDDLGFTGVKSRLNRLEKWIDQWNRDMEKTVGSEEGVIPPKIVPLRQTGYMTLDIQIPDPEIAPAPSTPGASRHGLPLEGQ